MSEIKDIMKFFELSVSEFTKMWKALTEEDKDQLRQGINDGTLSY